MNLTQRHLIGLASLFLSVACGGTDAPTGQAAGTGKTEAECNAQYTDCFSQCLCVSGDQPACVNKCSTTTAPPTGTTTPPTGTTTPPTGTTTPPTGTTTPPAPTGTTTPPAPTGTTTPPAPTGTTTPPAPPISGIKALTLTTDTFDVAPGAEIYRCQNFRNPFGKDVDIVESESFMTPGSHHMFVFRQAGLGDGAVVECGGLEFGEYIHTAQTPQQLYKYPAGIGRLLKANEGLRIQVHYVNTTDQPIKAQITVVLNYVDPDKVQYHAAQIFLNNVGVTVPNGTSTATKSFVLPKDIKLLGAASHMHKRAIHFDSKTSDGRTIYQTDQWDEPVAAEFTPAMDIAKGTSITYACTYQNNTGRTLVFGESAAKDEMCIFSGLFYPAEVDGTGISAQQIF